MPTSLVLYIETHDPLPAVFLGREVQAWFLKTVQEFNPTISRALHDGKSQKPYTVSSVLHLSNELSEISPTPHFIRITALTDEIENLLTGSFIKHLPRQMHIWYRTLLIRGYSFSADESPWAGQLSYRSLIHTAGALEDREFRLEFISPTGFRSNGADITQPDPAHIFRGCFQKWNAFAPLEMQRHKDLPRFIQETMIVRDRNNFELRRVIFSQGKRGGAVGFTGNVDLAIVPSLAGTEWGQDLSEWLAQVRTLVMFSFFCGVGHHATAGLGQAFPRLLRVEHP